MSTIETTEGTSPCMDLPKPTAEHSWLEQLVGEWTTEAEIHMVPGQPPMRTQGTESIRMLGGFWMISETVGEAMGFRSILTVGYNPAEDGYVGTWVDTMTSKLWNYTGTVDASKKKLVLNTSGDCPMEPGKVRTMRESIEITGPDTKTFTSEMLEDDGTWTRCVFVKATRVK